MDWVVVAGVVMVAALVVAGVTAAAVTVGKVVAPTPSHAAAPAPSVGTPEVGPVTISLFALGCSIRIPPGRLGPPD
ncbi:MAG: hypothetical protein ACYDC5_12110 [Candidatus Dormibacteria bacterium]